MPAGLVGTHRLWRYEAEPEFLTVDVGLEADTLSMTVRVRGQEHARFMLARLPKEALPRLKQQFAIAAGRSPEHGPSIDGVVKEAGPTAAADPIEAARRAVAAMPGDARARLALARVLRAAIRENAAANGPRYAGEMLEALQKAVELDPDWPDAYHWLAGYYMEAPPMAGGSLDKADATARALARIDATAAQELQARIDARRRQR
jgi:hypothetical protein